MNQDLPSGTALSHYLVVSKIRAGGMGEVYLAGDEKISRDVAIKVLPAAFSADAERLRRFEQEAQAAGALNHPNILVVYDVGTTSVENGDAPYVVSELLEGRRCANEWRASHFHKNWAALKFMSRAFRLRAANGKFPRLGARSRVGAPTGKSFSTSPPTEN